MYFFETIVNAVQLSAIKRQGNARKLQICPFALCFCFYYQSAAIFGIFHYVLFSIKHWISVISKLLHSVFIF